MLCACTTQNFDPESTKADETLELESQMNHENYIEVEGPILELDSVKKELEVQKSITPGIYYPKEKRDKITYVSIRYEDTAISFKILSSVNDSFKDHDTSGYITKGSNGLNRKEVRDVYINGMFSHTETVKETYLVSKAVDEQKSIGTKEPVQEEDSWESLGYRFYKKYDSFETCNLQVDELAHIISKKSYYLP